MPKRPCLVCGLATRNGSYCPAHVPPAWKRRSPSSRAVKRPGWNRLRARALLRDGRRCVRCGDSERLAVHHVVPVAEGGAMTLDNLTVLCEHCHGAAHGRSPAA